MVQETTPLNEQQRLEAAGRASAPINVLSEENSSAQAILGLDVTHLDELRREHTAIRTHLTEEQRVKLDTMHRLMDGHIKTLNAATDIQESQRKPVVEALAKLRAELAPQLGRMEFGRISADMKVNAQQFMKENPETVQRVGVIAGAAVVAVAIWHYFRDYPVIKTIATGALAVGAFFYFPGAAEGLQKRIKEYQENGKKTQNDVKTKTEVQQQAKKKGNVPPNQPGQKNSADALKVYLDQYAKQVIATNTAIAAADNPANIANRMALARTALEEIAREMKLIETRPPGAEQTVKTIRAELIAAEQRLLKYITVTLPTQPEQKIQKDIKNNTETQQPPEKQKIENQNNQQPPEAQKLKKQNQMEQQGKVDNAGNPINNNNQQPQTFETQEDPMQKQAREDAARKQLEADAAAAKLKMQNQPPTAEGPIETIMTSKQFVERINSLVPGPILPQLTGRWNIDGVSAEITATGVLINGRPITVRKSVFGGNFRDMDVMSLHRGPMGIAGMNGDANTIFIRRTDLPANAAASYSSFGIATFGERFVQALQSIGKSGTYNAGIPGLRIQIVN